MPEKRERTISEILHFRGSIYRISQKVKRPFSSRKFHRKFIGLFYCTVQIGLKVACSQTVHGTSLLPDIPLFFNLVTENINFF